MCLQAGFVTSRLAWSQSGSSINFSHFQCTNTENELFSEDAFNISGLLRENYIRHTLLFKASMLETYIIRHLVFVCM